VRYEFLGPFRVLNGNREIRISASKMEVLLVTLLTRPGQVVRTDQLIEEIWSGDPPRRALASVHVYVSQLRKLLSCSEHEDSPIRTRPPGYLVVLGEDRADWCEFRSLVQKARECLREGRHEVAELLCRSALDLWRGPVLDGVKRGPLTEVLATCLVETRLECLEMRMDAALEMGRHRELVGELFALTNEHPFRESFYRQLMLALYRSERQAEALQVYMTAWNTLNRELGVRPCRSLQQLHQSILRADGSLHRLPLAVGS
jgi:SARP family transcriptional regulator, regulator of embCAB operon